MNYRHRIEEIARRDGITIGYDARNILDSYSEVGSRRLGLAPWDAPGTKREHQQYWIALHEMGHVATTDPRFDPGFMAFVGAGREILDTEARAWEWAINEAGALDDVGRTVIDAAMGTYASDFGPGGEAARQLAQKVTASGAFSSHRRAEVLSLLA